MAAMKKGGLGRGLDALFADAVPVEKPIEDTIEEIAAISSKKKKASNNVEKSTTSNNTKDVNSNKEAEELDDNTEKVKYLNIHDIKPNVNQPRKVFNEEKIAELANSIKEHGIIQPLVVRKKGRVYEIVAGERRWRAAMKAELPVVPCLIRELSDEQNMLVAIIENMQREDLNPLEEAEGINQMVVTYGLTQEEVSKSVGKSRPYITNALRLLKLPEYIQAALSEGNISAGHGRALVAVENEEHRKIIFNKIIAEELSVRETEKLVNEIGKPKKKPAKKNKNPDAVRVEEELKGLLGTKVSIKQNGRKGKIELEYYNKEELNRLIELLRTIQ